MSHVAYDVRDAQGRLIDTVFYSAKPDGSSPVTAEDVKRSLINHDGYASDITVRRARSTKKK